MVKGAQASSLSDFSIERPTLIKNVVPPATVPPNGLLRQRYTLHGRLETEALPGILLASRTA